MRVVCIGAHPDDIEIGCGGALLRLLEEHPCSVTTLTLSATAARRREMQNSLAAFLQRAVERRMRSTALPDGQLPTRWGDAKRAMRALAKLASPDLVFTHQLDDRHQDHRVAAELTWTEFRDHLIFEYEIPKYEGSSAQPNAFVTLSDSTARRKVELLLAGHESQRLKPWYRREVFEGLLALRGIECRSPSGFAEAFVSRKVVL